LDLKKFLKTIKLHEESISVVLGALAVVAVGIFAVNYFKTKVGTVTPSNGENTTTSEKVHTVVKGETLWSIAEDAFGSGYNWVDIYNANKLTSDKIEVGQKLTIPEASPKKPTATKKLMAVNEKQNSISDTTYTIVKGDSLWQIAVRAYGDGYKWVEIAKANKLTNPNVIHAGNVLTLPR
jgi:nucleoid-associated protein YgaU